MEEAREWSPAGENRTVKVKPKIGLSVNGEDVEVTCRDDAQMAQARAGLVKGDIVTVEVEALPPFGSRGAVTYALPGAITRQRHDWK